MSVQPHHKPLYTDYTSDFKQIHSLLLPSAYTHMLYKVTLVKSWEREVAVTTEGKAWVNETTAQSNVGAKQFVAVVCHFFVTAIYLCQGGYVFIDVCLLVSRLMQKILNLLSQNSVKRRHMGHRKKRLDFCGNPDCVTLELGLGP